MLPAESAVVGDSRMIQQELLQKESEAQSCKSVLQIRAAGGRIRRSCNRILRGWKRHRCDLIGESCLLKKTTSSVLSGTTSFETEAASQLAVRCIWN
ncbi:hypothetical protein LINGRAHAP2_LOCUS10260 [Linum grandiflorum]